MRTLLPFEYLEPDTIDLALTLLANADCSILAGGVDLVLSLRLPAVTTEAVSVTSGGGSSLRAIAQM